MFEETISKQTAENLVALGESSILDNAYLAGGTALALQVGHRISYDLDFFTNKKFKPHLFLKKIGKFANYQHQETSWQTVLGRLGDVKFSLFYYPYPVIENFSNFKEIKLASINDIAAMKIAAISERGTKRDFVDLYFILKKMTISQALDLYDKKYQKLASNSVHVKKSLVYFKDADQEPMPRMLEEIAWLEIKKYFEDLIKGL